MTKLLCLFLLFVSIISPAAPPGDDPIVTTAGLIKKMSLHEFAKMFASSIDLTILDKEDVYSAAQAEIVLTEFFKSNPVKSVTVLHRVTSNPNIRFAVFTIVTSNGTYRTSVSLKLTDGTFLVNELRIETEKD